MSRSCRAFAKLAGHPDRFRGCGRFVRPVQHARLPPAALSSSSHGDPQSAYPPSISRQRHAMCRAPSPARTRSIASRACGLFTSGMTSNGRRRRSSRSSTVDTESSRPRRRPGIRRSMVACVNPYIHDRILATPGFLFGCQRQRVLADSLTADVGAACPPPPCAAKAQAVMAYQQRAASMEPGATMDGMTAAVDAPATGCRVMAKNVADVHECA